MYNLLKNHSFLLSIIWLICIILVNPIGDFPLNDDWSYARNAQALALENKIYFDDWGAMTLIAHTMWGAFFCKIFGFSFTVLRFSTLVLGWIGLLVTFRFFQEGGMKKNHAFWATILFAFNPFYFANSFSYMTEVPFMCFLMTAAYFSLKAINGKGQKNIFLAALFSIIATMIRQPGVLVPIAFSITYVTKNKLSLKTLIQGITPTFLTLGSLILFTIWRNENYGLSKNFGKTSQLLDNISNGNLADAITTKSVGFFILWGLFLLPILIVLVSNFWKKIPTTGKIISVVIALLLSYPFYHSLADSYLGNTFLNLGIGPLVLPFEGEFPISQMHKNDWKNFTLIGFISGIVLLQWILIRTTQLLFFIKNKTSVSVNWNTFFGLATAFGYFAFLMLNNFYFDRYSLVAIPFLILMLFPQNANFSIPRLLKIVGHIALATIILFSIGATHDYLSWNRARWEAANYSHQVLQLEPAEINGGLEYKKWFGIFFNRPPGYQGLEDWESLREHYIISHSEQCLFTTLKSFPYTRYFPPKRDAIYLLEKENFSHTDTITCNAELLSENDQRFLTNKNEIQLMNVETRVSDKAHSGKYSILLDSEHPYGFTFTMENLQPCEKILVICWKFSPTNAVKAVMAMEGDFYLSNPDLILDKDENGWTKQAQEFTIPKDYKGTKATFFFFNPTAEKVYFDDLMIVRIR
ncbi:MAG: ArnT family glycosyltransferase [Saprospiraceae bacterium]